MDCPLHLTWNTVRGYLKYRGTREFEVQPLGAQSASFEGVPQSIALSAGLPSFTVRFRDRFLNLVNHAGTVMYRNTSNATATGSIPTNPTGLGVVSSSAFTPPGAGNYALSASGIAAGNTLGTSAFSVNADTSGRLVLFSIEPQSLSVGDSSLHHWTLQVKGENFSADSRVYGKNNNIQFATAFIDASTLTAVVPVSLRQLGILGLEVRSSSPASVSSMIPVFVFEPSLEYSDSLDIISPVPPTLTAEEQTALAILDTNALFVHFQPIRFAIPPSQMLMSGQIGIRLPVMSLEASIALNYPKQVGERSFVVEGRVESDTVKSGTLMVLYEGRFVQMDFSINGKRYILQPLGDNGVHVVAELAHSSVGLPCGVAYKEGAHLQESEPSPIVSCGDRRKIRVLFLATDNASRLGNTPFGYIPSLAASIRAQIYRTNIALQQSLEWSDKSSVQIELANEQPIPWDPLRFYTESLPDIEAGMPDNEGKFFRDEINFINYITDTKLVSPTSISTNTFSYTAVRRRKAALNANFYIQRLREQYEADIVAIILSGDIPHGGGVVAAGFVSQIPGRIVSESGKPDIVPGEDNAFLFLNSRSFTGGGNPYLLAHELGHLLGGMHTGDATSNNNLGARFGYSDELPVAPGYNTSPAKTIMAMDGNPSVPLFSSPAIKLPGAFYAYQADYLTLIDKEKYREIDLKSRATNQLPAHLVFPDSRPLGSHLAFDVTSTIDRYSPAIAAYRNSGVDIRVRLDETPPFSGILPLNKGQSRNVPLRFSVCEANAHRAQIIIYSGARILQHYDEVFGGVSERDIVYQVTMPNDADYSGITGIVLLETLGGSAQTANYSSDTQYFKIACGDCSISGLKAFASAQSASTQNRPQKVNSSEDDGRLKVYPIAPNPVVSGNAELRVVLPESGEIHATVYNALGLPVKDILHERLRRGEYVIPFSTQDLPSGAYTCRIAVGNRIMRQTITIVK